MNMITELPDSAKQRDQDNMTPVERELTEIQKALSGLTAIREKLSQKIDVAMLPDHRVDRGADEDRDVPARSELTSRLRLISERITLETEELQQLMIRLEL